MKMNKKIFLLILGAVIIILGAAFNAWLRTPGEYSGPADSMVVSYLPVESSTLLWIADDQHFFSRNGLNVTFHEYVTGPASLDGLLKGEADIAVTSEYPLVGKVFQKERIRTIGCIDKLDFAFLLGRKDRGIEKVSDLKGKRVGTQRGTILDFYLGRFLELNGMNMQDITFVDVKTLPESVNAIINGSVDAVATDGPYASSIKDTLGANAVVWQVQSSQSFYLLMVSNEEWIKRHPELVTRFLKSLAQAQDFTINHPAEAKAIVQKRLNVDADYMDTVWRQNQYTLSLDQSLVLAMEDEARWMINNNLTTEKKIPDFLDYIDEDGLRAIKPEAVNIIR
jgi:NitT/TauT family transport system substrate-binding protein